MIYRSRSSDKHVLEFIIQLSLYLLTCLSAAAKPFIYVNVALRKRQETFSSRSLARDSRYRRGFHSHKLPRCTSLKGDAGEKHKILHNLLSWTTHNNYFILFPEICLSKELSPSPWRNLIHRDTNGCSPIACIACRFQFETVCANNPIEALIIPSSLSGKRFMKPFSRNVMRAT